MKIKKAVKVSVELHILKERGNQRLKVSLSKDADLNFSPELSGRNEIFYQLSMSVYNKMDG